MPERLPCGKKYLVDGGGRSVSADSISHKYLLRLPQVRHRTVNNSILSRFGPEDLAALRSDFQFVQFRERSLLQDQRKRIDHIGFVESGLISLRKVSKDDVVELALLGKDGIVGATRLLGSGESTHQCVSVTAGSLLLIPADRLLTLLDERQHIKEPLYRHVRTLFAHCSQVALCGLHHNLQQRVAGWLCQASTAAGIMDIPVTHDYLSTGLGLRRASVTKALNRLEEDGLIMKTRGSICVRSRPLLEARACDCHSTIANL